MEPQLDNAQVLTSGTDLAENFNLEGNISTKLYLENFSRHILDSFSEIGPS